VARFVERSSMKVAIVCYQDLCNFVLLRVALKQYEISPKGSRESLAHKVILMVRQNT